MLFSSWGLLCNPKRGSMFTFSRPSRRCFGRAIFLIVAIIAAIFGFGGIAAEAAWIAKILFFLFVVLFVVFLIIGARAARVMTRRKCNMGPENRDFYLPSRKLAIT